MFYQSSTDVIPCQERLYLGHRISTGLMLYQSYADVIPFQERLHRCHVHLIPFEQVKARGRSYTFLPPLFYISGTKVVRMLCQGMTFVQLLSENNASSVLTAGRLFMFSSLLEHVLCTKHWCGHNSKHTCAPQDVMETGLCTEFEVGSSRLWANDVSRASGKKSTAPPTAAAKKPFPTPESYYPFNACIN